MPCETVPSKSQTRNWQTFFAKGSNLKIVFQFGPYFYYFLFLYMNIIFLVYFTIFDCFLEEICVYNFNKFDLCNQKALGAAQISWKATVWPCLSQTNLRSITNQSIYHMPYYSNSLLLQSDLAIFEAMLTQNDLL